MPRSPTYVPRGGALVETTCRTVQGRHLLKPGPELNDVVAGVLGRALEYARVELYACAFASNHYHLLYWAENALQMARFQGYFNANLAREVCRLNDWSDKVWARRYRPMVVSDEPDAQWQRLRYVLAQGAKEGLVESPLEWPGVHAAGALVAGAPLVGHWFNRTKEWAARRRGEAFDKYDYATRYEIELAPLPAFRHLSPEAYRQRVAALITEIEEQAAVERDGRPAMGAQKVRAFHPHHRPAKVKREPAPKLFFAASKETYRDLRRDFEAFVARYRTAAERLFEAVARGDKLNPAREFPAGSFPPAMPFVGAVLPPPRTPPSRRIVDRQEDGYRWIVRDPVPVIRVAMRRAPPACA